MNIRRIRVPEPSTEVVILDGGLNEAVSSIEMKPGELTLCKNYYITEGSTGGYVSVKGYERYDGQPSPAGVVATEIDDAAREAARALITPVPGTGLINGIHIFKGKTYAVRNKIDGLTAGLYVESAAGWVEIDTSAAPLAPGGRYTFITYNFLGTAAGETMYWTSGVDNACYYDGTTFGKITTGMVADTPEFLAAHLDRLWLTFPGGSLQYSTSGDPTDWTTDAGEIGVGYDITALSETVGNVLVVFGRSNIKILEGAISTDWVLKHYSDAIGAYRYTVCKLFDTLIFMSDMGVTTLSAAQEFGDFASSAISEKVKTQLLNLKNNITCASVVHNLNQYRLYFDNGVGFVFSFRDKKLRGITSISYTHYAKIAINGIDTNNTSVNFFVSTSPFVYKQDTGTSFDGNEITYRLATTYYHYKTPRYLKRFLRVTFEIAANSNLTYSIRTDFDYRTIHYPRGSSQDFEILSVGDLWGEGVWGTMIWAGAEGSRVFYDILGLGSNMSLSLLHTSKYTNQHILQNFITDFLVVGRQM